MAAPIVRSSNLEFLLARANEARAEANVATLAHVRERCRRSEAAWSALAHRAERSALLREAETLRKSEQPLQS